MKPKKIKTAQLRIEDDDPAPDERAIAAIVTPEMAGRADARELREFLHAYMSIDDPEDRLRILRALQAAGS